jgi:hypothetical protein
VFYLLDTEQSCTGLVFKNDISKDEIKTKHAINIHHHHKTKKTTTKKLAPNQRQLIPM